MRLRACAIFCAFAPVAIAATCESLASLSLANTVIAAEDSPEYCRVTATVKPVPDSEVKVEIWLPPAKQWNGKFLGTGNGGYSGAIGYQDMRGALQQGYATAVRNRRVSEEVAMSVPVLIEDRVLATIAVRFAASAVPLRVAVERFIPKLHETANIIRQRFTEAQGTAQ